MNWDKDWNPTDGDASAMQSIARGLTETQIKAVAAYLSELE
jgi:hypothetical protein